MLHKKALLVRNKISPGLKVIDKLSSGSLHRAGGVIKGYKTEISFFLPNVERNILLICMDQLKLLAYSITLNDQPD